MSEPPGFFLRITDHGVERRVRLYSTTSDWSRDVRISQDEKSVTMVGNQQLRFTTEDNKDYIRHKLWDTRVSWACDLSHVKRNWNCAFYTCDLSGLPVPGYLDAQSGRSVCEMDYMEACRSSYHYTAHREYDRNGSMIMGLGGSVQGNHHQKFSCDQVPYKPEDLYGPGKWIDTDHPFRVSVTHSSQGVYLELTQNDHLIYKHDTGGNGGDYLSSIKPTLEAEKHTFIMSLWTGWMQWLSGGLPWYPEDHIPQVEAVISDIRIEAC